MDNWCYCRDVGEWVLSVRLVYRAEPAGLSCNELAVVYAVSKRGIEFDPHGTETNLSKRRRVVRCFEYQDRAIEWLARLPEDDPPDFSTMGIEVE